MEEGVFDKGAAKLGVELMISPKDAADETAAVEKLCGSGGLESVICDGNGLLEEFGRGGDGDKRREFLVPEIVANRTAGIRSECFDVDSASGHNCGHWSLILFIVRTVCIDYV
jgi:hypothetical protein